MMSNLHELIPGADAWPHFVRNRSEQFEARVVMLAVEPSPSLFFEGMAGSRLPVAVAHGEGYAEFADEKARAGAEPIRMTAASRPVVNLEPIAHPLYPAHPGPEG